MKKFLFYLNFLILVGIQYSCDENFFEVPAIGVTSETTLQNKQGVDQLLISVYTMLKGTALAGVPVDPIYGTMRGGEGYKSSFLSANPEILESAKAAISTGNALAQNVFDFYYDAIYRANLVLKNVDKANDMTDAQKTLAKAEARFLRGHFYFILKKTFYNIPYIDETIADFRVPNTDENGNYVNIWPQISEDFDFARKNLPATQSDLGRPNQWAAESYYAKVLIYRAGYGEYPNGYDEALPILTNIIENGVTSSGDKYDLEDAYHKNFNCEFENGPESVFAVQHSVNDGTPSGSRANNEPNASPMNIWIGSLKTGKVPGETGYQFFSPTEWLADHFRVDEDGLPYLDMYDTNPHRLKDDFGMAPPKAGTVDTFKIDKVPVDPRLDWTMGRRNVPFLGYGPMPGSFWMKDQKSNGPYFVKKYFIWYDQIGVFADAGYSQNGLNHPIIRFADILLFAAEVEARVGSLDNARHYVNRVRQRMVDNDDNPYNRVKKVNGTDAANYLIAAYPVGGIKDPFQSKQGALDAILYERSLELGMEGSRFYDLLRFGKLEEELTSFYASAKLRYNLYNDAVFTEIPDKFLPIPQKAIDNSQKGGLRTLKQNPGY